MAAAVVGVDFGTESCRAGVFDAVTGEAWGFCSEPYPTAFPKPGCAEQDPRHWWRAMGAAVRGAIAAAEASRKPRPVAVDVAALCVDTTCCTVVAFDRDHPQREPLMPAILWMDMRAADQAARVLATKDPAVIVNGAGRGPVSAEWFLPKALWIKEHAPEVWARASVAEFQDWINLRLTGCYVASRNNVGVRWHWVEAAAADGAGGSNKEEEGDDPTPAHPPLSLLRALGIEEELRARWPGEKVLELGARVGDGLTAEAAEHLGLKAGTIVAQGGADAFIGMLGLGVTKAGEMAMLTGSSHLHLGLSDRPLHAPGMFGSYAGALLPGLHVVEGGQTSTGSAVAWLKGRVLGASAAAEAAAEDEDEDDDKGSSEQKNKSKRPRRPPPAQQQQQSGPSYVQLDAEAALLPPGSDGLLALDHFQGNRTPHTDARSRGALVGLTLAHSPAHLHRALLEGVCFGTEAVLDAMRRAGFHPTRLLVAGGATRSPLWLQMHADVSGLPLSVPRGASDAPALGCAILAAAAAGFHGGSIAAAAGAMVRVERTLEPDAEAAAAYAPVYRRWSGLYPALKATFHGEGEEEKQPVAAAPAPPPIVPAPSPATAAPPTGTTTGPIAIAPSLLAADLSDLPSELARLDGDGAPSPSSSWLHYDCFDGSLGTQITFGAPLLEKLRARTRRKLDVHLIARDPLQHLRALKAAGADALTVQFENVFTVGHAGGERGIAVQQQNLKQLLCEARALEFPAGVGLALALGTPAEFASVFLPLVERVLVMAVPLGYGGQAFQRDETLRKIRMLRQMVSSRGLSVSIGVDGGVGEGEAADVARAGADFIVAGSSVFRAKGGASPAEAERALLRAALKGAAEAEFAAAK